MIPTLQIDYKKLNQSWTFWDSPLKIGNGQDRIPAKLSPGRIRDLNHSKEKQRYQFVFYKMKQLIMQTYLK